MPGCQQGARRVVVAPVLHLLLLLLVLVLYPLLSQSATVLKANIKVKSSIADVKEAEDEVKSEARSQVKEVIEAIGEVKEANDEVKDAADDEAEARSLYNLFFGCHYGSYYPHDQVVESIPECCRQLKCEYGNITKAYYNQPGEHGCCVFDGHMYAQGTVLPGFCWKMECQNSEWVFTGCIDNCCGHCTVHTDLHFVTFDGHTYDFHGTCNHTLTQKITEDFYTPIPTFQARWRYNPDVAVYSDFEPCFGSGSCLDESTFQDNPNTIITLQADSVFTLGVNGNSFVVPATGVHQVAFPDCDVYHPVLAFQYNGCVVLLGSSRLVVMSCPYRLDVWAHPSLFNQLNGLCGFYSEYQKDDFTDRLNRVKPLESRPLEFATYWQTLQQIDEQCMYPCKEEGKGCNGNLQPLPQDACVVSDPLYVSARTFCVAELSADVDQYHIDSCAHDLCIMRRNGNQLEAQMGWLHTLALNANTSRRLQDAKECLAPTTTTTTTTVASSTIDIEAF